MRKLKISDWLNVGVNVTVLAFLGFVLFHPGGIVSREAVGISDTLGFVECLRSDLTTARLAADMALAKRLGIHADIRVGQGDALRNTVA